MLSRAYLEFTRDFFAEHNRSVVEIDSAPSTSCGAYMDAVQITGIGLPDVDVAVERSVDLAAKSDRISPFGRHWPSEMTSPSVSKLRDGAYHLPDWFVE